MVYNATYSGDDAAPIIIDVGGKVLVAMGTLATVIGLFIAVNLLRGKKWNGRG